jgi:hypothetical protein
MKRLIICRSDTVGILLDTNGCPSPKPQNWYELSDDEFETVEFMKELIDANYTRFVFSPIKFETGTITAYHNNVKSVIGYWKPT